MNTITEKERVTHNLIVRALEINDASNGECGFNVPLHCWEYLQEAVNEYRKAKGDDLCLIQ